MTSAQVARLRAFASKDGMERHLLFSTGLSIPSVGALVPLFADKGFPLSGAAITPSPKA